MNRYVVIGGVVILVGAIGAALMLRGTEGAAPEAQSIAAVSSGEHAASGFIDASTAPAQAAPSAIAPLRQAPAGFKEYRNSTYRVSLFYPGDLALKEYDEGGGAATITFQDIKTAQGFQIFVVPYTALQVSADRFRKDEPSGVMQNPIPLSIDGATATAFFGRDQLLGPTREVWMLHGGYLFEITAPQSQDEWLGNTMLSWKFI